MHASTQSLAFIEGIGGPELMMIMFIVLLLFGGQKLPELAKGLGKSVREFKKAASNVEEEFKRAMDEVPDKPLPKTFPPKPVVPPPNEPSPPPPQS
ncbi:MAG: twin-arginine translocase TatA/TatE family subunit [Cephaloticoccus sp.]|nr:twin-arginine translocase TatA/TatE family subunit [Cephaloticoccus sp.]MCF7758961.1 twin-arginine translocase TatA/TatE family subunit [Cephaloticoccus sp.]